MRFPSRLYLALAATLAPWLAALCGCSDSGADPTGPGSTQSVPTVATPAVVLDIDTGPRELPVGASILLIGGVSLASTGQQLQTPIAWSSPGTAILAVQQLAPQAVRITALKPGVTTVQASAGGITRQLDVTVLPVTTQPTTLVAVDFRMLEVQTGANNWEYAPQLVLRDGSAQGGSALIAVNFEVPGLGPAPSCSMVRPVGSAPVEIFHEMYGDYELTIGGGVRANGSEAIARLTVRTAGGAAATLVLHGPIVPGSSPTTYSGGLFSGALACGG
jgi:hypothetical protein